MNSSERREGFTLVELLLVVAILSALSTIAVPRMAASSTEARISACDTNVDIMNRQIEVFMVQTGKAPAQFGAGDFTTMLSMTDYFPDGAPGCPFGSTYKFNPSTKHVDCHNHGR